MAVDDFIDVIEAGKILEISPAAVHQLASRGTMPSQWIAGKRVWKRETVVRLKNDAGYQKRSRRNGKGEAA